MSEIENLTRVRPVKSVPAAKERAAKRPAAKRPAAKEPAAKERAVGRRVTREGLAKDLPSFDLSQSERDLWLEAMEKDLGRDLRTPPEPEREAADEDTWAVGEFEAVGTDWTVNEWRIVGSGSSGDSRTASLRNVHNGKYVRSISTGKLWTYRFIPQLLLDRVEEKRKAAEAAHAEWMRLEEEEARRHEARMRAEYGASYVPVRSAPRKTMLKLKLRKDGTKVPFPVSVPYGGPRWESHLDEKILKKADALDRKRWLAAAKTGGGPCFAESDGKGWLMVEGFTDALAKRSPWIVHPASALTPVIRGSLAEREVERILSSRNFSVTRVAKDGSGATWVKGDVVPPMKKDELVGAAISVDNMAVCQPVTPMKVGEKPVTAVATAAPAAVKKAKKPAAKTRAPKK